MPLDSFLLNLLEDPVDHGKLLYVPSQDVLYNPRLRVAYEVRDSIPVMLPDEARQVGEDEARTFEEDPGARLTGEADVVSSAARRSWPCPGRRRRTCSPDRSACRRPRASSTVWS